MTILTEEKRKKIPKSKFGMPDEEKYPMQDRKHATNAKARASEMVNKGKLSESAKNKIFAKSNKILAHRTLSGIRK